MNNMPDPKKTYVLVDTWGHFMLPLEQVALLKDMLHVDKTYNSESKDYDIKPKKDAVSFKIVGSDELARMIAVAKLEN